MSSSTFVCAGKKPSKRQLSQVADSGLAWRRERRRTKLTVRALRQLLTVAHALAGPSSQFPDGPRSRLNPPASDEQENREEVKNNNAAINELVDDDDAVIMAELEKKVQDCLDDIVEVRVF